MANNIKPAFDSICAGSKLKLDTMLYVQKEIQKRNKTKGYAMLRQYAVALVSVTIFFITGIFAYNLYFTPAAYVDVDVNPSIELTLNRLNKVIGFYAYNKDGDDIVNDLSLTHKDYEDALVILMESMEKQGYFQDDGLVSVTLQTDDADRESVMLSHIQTGINEYMADHHHATQIDIFSVSGDTRSHSHAQGVSPAKYLAIQELIKIDPTASVEGCRNHSISEIKQMMRDHDDHHIGDDNDVNPFITENNSSHNENTDDDTQPSEQGNGHHGGGSVNGHRRSGH